jgi:uncharacterized Tic20 family protein
MENQPLSSKIRRSPMLCHLAGLSWAFASISLLVWVMLSGSEALAQYFALFVCPLVGIILAMFLTLLVWAFTINAHPFIRDAARSINNFMLSCCLYLVVLFVMTIATCGLVNTSPIISTIVSTFGYVAMFLDPFLLLLHSGLIIFGAVLANKGQVYQYPITINFLNNP